MDLIFSFDISTTTTGVGIIVVDNGKIVSVDSWFYKPDKSLDIIQMLYIFKKDIIGKVKSELAKYDNCNVHIAVEDIILYMKNSTAATTTLLSAINRLLCVSLFEEFNNVNLIHVNTIRSTLRKKAGVDKLDKEMIPDILEDIIGSHIDGWKFGWEKGKKGNVKKESYDKADALAVGICYLLKNF